MHGLSISSFRTRAVRVLTGGALAVATGVSAAIAQDYPTKPITMIVPFTAGGAGDILARTLSLKLEQTWGRGFVVENRVGAGGVVGAVATQKAPADGYTLMIAPSATMAVNVTLFKSLPYDPAKDFIPLALPARTPFVLVAHPSLPVASVADFIKYAKAPPKPLFYATAGPGVPHHLFAELLKSMTGADMQPVAYKGSLPALNDVVAGHVPVMFVDLGPAIAQVQAGTVRALGVSTAMRLASLPNVPPVNDAAPGFDVASWQMIVAPAGTPRPIVENLHRDIAKAMDDPGVRGQIEKAGMVPVSSPSLTDLQAFVKSEIAQWSDVVRKAGVEGSQ